MASNSLFTMHCIIRRSIISSMDNVVKSTINKRISTVRQRKISGAQKATSYFAETSELGMGFLQPPFQRIPMDLPSGTKRLQGVPTTVLLLGFKSGMPKDLLPCPLMRDCFTHRQLAAHDMHYVTTSAAESKSEAQRLLFLQQIQRDRCVHYYLCRRLMVR